MIQKIKHSLKDFGQTLKTYAWIISLILSLGALAFGAYSIKLANKGPLVIQAGSSIATTNSSLPADGLINELSGDQPTLGNDDAPLTLIEMADFQCPFCKKFFDESFSTIKQNYIDTGKVKFIFVNLAFLGQESKDAAEAGMCAKDQGKFWEYHDEIYKNQGGENLGVFSTKKLQELAKTVGLNIAEFNSCMTNDKHLKAIEQEKAIANKYGFMGTPTFIIKDKVIKGAYPIDTFSKALDAALEE